MLQEVEEALELVWEHAAMPKVIRVAAHAALMLAQKYHSLNDECEVYRIAIGAQNSPHSFHGINEDSHSHVP
jgi:hypothetical protein